MGTVPLCLIDDNPFNSRTAYNEDEIAKLASSMSEVGLLTPIKVRHTQGRYELVYGHRRVRAARLLQWEEIEAEVGKFSDPQMLQFSLVENLAREDLVDYEEALSFRRLNRDFSLTYEEIGKLAGCSKQHVCNHLAMLELFDEEHLKQNPTLKLALYQITEHHARLLRTLGDQRERELALLFVVREKLSVRDLHRMIHKLRSWFREQADQAVPNLMSINLREAPKRGDDSAKQKEEIQKVLQQEFDLCHSGDFETFIDLYLLDDDFSLFDDLPPYQRSVGPEARQKICSWFYSIGPKFTTRMHDLNIRFFNGLALATLYVEFKWGRSDHASSTSRGTVVLEKRDSRWLIIHEHWSKLTNQSESQEVWPAILSPIL